MIIATSIYPGGLLLILGLKNFTKQEEFAHIKSRSDKAAQRMATIDIAESVADIKQRESINSYLPHSQRDITLLNNYFYLQLS